MRELVLLVEHKKGACSYVRREHVFMQRACFMGLKNTILLCLYDNVRNIRVMYAPCFLSGNIAPYISCDILLCHWEEVVNVQ